MTVRTKSKVVWDYFWVYPIASDISRKLPDKRVLAAAVYAGYKGNNNFLSVRIEGKGPDDSFSEDSYKVDVAMFPDYAVFIWKESELP